ncbi:hypothetical protein KPK_B0114 (plasmid) [Klebsiella variicola]|uniref:Uncharacterized protein n=2 Tax=Klebsiella pneumoniae complex TaxID=3390273 RepID=B5RKR7_KLEV3|nr:hypothetical protein KPK_B0114 [Klebsiella variicola]BAN19507.1 hypothetical protein KPX_B0067 [Klebsiella pneumoniae subsp. pneumoniae KPX]
MCVARVWADAKNDKPFGAVNGCFGTATSRGDVTLISAQFSI